jgi:hypothetical protein
MPYSHLKAFYEGGKGYPTTSILLVVNIYLHVHTAYGEDGYTLHVQTDDGVDGYTLHIHIARGERINPHVHTAAGVKEKTPMSTLLAVKWIQKHPHIHRC